MSLIKRCIGIWAQIIADTHEMFHLVPAIQDGPHTSLVELESDATKSTEIEYYLLPILEQYYTRKISHCLILVYVQKYVKIPWGPHRLDIALVF